MHCTEIVLLRKVNNFSTFQARIYFGKYKMLKTIGYKKENHTRGKSPDSDNAASNMTGCHINVMKTVHENTSMASLATTCHCHVYDYQ